jgi:hypothetical protein
MVSSSEEGQAVLPMLMIMDIQWNKLQGNSIWRNAAHLLYDQLCKHVVPSTITYASIPAADHHQVELRIEKHKERRYLEIYVHADVYFFTLVTGWEK